MKDEQALVELLEDFVNRGASTAEEIHRRVADMPLTVLEELGVFERTANDVKQIQHATIGGVYELIRNVNHEVARLAGDLLERRESNTTDTP